VSFARDPTSNAPTSKAKATEDSYHSAPVKWPASGPGNDAPDLEDDAPDDPAVLELYGGGLPTFAGAVAAQIPPEMRQRLSTWRPVNTPDPRVFWFDDRGWRFWCWAAAYAAAIVFDVWMISR
jgi:hypothetical protein